VEYINYTRNMGFEQDPDYEYLRGLFKQVMTAHNFLCDNEFDWFRTSAPQVINSPFFILNLNLIYDLLGK
jgi:hypothetical protein